MRAAFMYGTGDVRVIDVPDTSVHQPTDVLVRVVHGGPAPVPAYIEELMPDILDGTVEPGKVFDRTVGLEQTPQGYAAMDRRDALKVLVKP